MIRALIGLAVLLVTSSASAGYTHYWKWKIVPPAARVEACLPPMEKLIEKRRAILADPKDRTGEAAVFRDTAPFGDGGELPRLAFNGIGDNAQETFAFPVAAFADDPSFTFVKTNWKPYDEVVAACLIVARDCFPRDELEIRSDGTWANEWQAGAALYEDVLGRKAKNPLTEVDVPAISPFAPPTTLPPDEADEKSVRRRQKIGAFALGGIVAIAVVLLWEPRRKRR